MVERWMVERLPESENGFCWDEEASVEECRPAVTDLIMGTFSIDGIGT